MKTKLPPISAPQYRALEYIIATQDSAAPATAKALQARGLIEGNPALDGRGRWIPTAWGREVYERLSKGDFCRICCTPLAGRRRTNDGPGLFRCLTCARRK